MNLEDLSPTESGGFSNSRCAVLRGTLAVAGPGAGMAPSCFLVGSLPLTDPRNSAGMIFFSICMRAMLNCDMTPQSKGKKKHRKPQPFQCEAESFSQLF